MIPKIISLFSARGSFEHPNFCSTSSRRVVVQDRPGPSAGKSTGTKKKSKKNRVSLAQCLFRSSEDEEEEDVKVGEGESFFAKVTTFLYI